MEGKGRVIVRCSSRWKPRYVWEPVIESVGEASFSMLELGPLVFFLVLYCCGARAKGARVVWL